MAAVIAPTRLPIAAHAKLTNPVSTKLKTLLPEMAQWSAGSVICTFGTTMAKAGSEKSFYWVDHDLPALFARAARQHSADGVAR